MAVVVVGCCCAPDSQLEGVVVSVSDSGSKLQEVHVLSSAPRITWLLHKRDPRGPL